MLVHLRRSAAVVAAVLVGLGLIVFDPNAPAALAFQAPPPITWNPSAVGTEANTMTPDQWSRALNSNPNKVYSNPGTTGSAAGKVGASVAGSGAGTGAMAVGAFLVGTELGTEVAGVMGLPTSGSFICDVGTTLGSSCALQAAPQYAPNSDIVVGQPGWTLDPAFLDRWGATSTMTISDGSVTYDSAARASGKITAGGLYSGAPRQSSSGSMQWSVTAVLETICRDSTGKTSAGNTVVSLKNSTISGTTTYAMLDGVNAPAATRSWVCNAGQQLDHFRFTHSHDEYPIGTPSTKVTSVTDWFPEGHPQRPVKPSADPTRWWKTTWQCSAGAPGGSQQSNPFKEGDAEWPPFPSAQCDAGSVVSSLLVEQITEGLSVPTKVFDWTADPDYLGWAANTPKECMGGGCQLLLERIDQHTGTRLSCFANPSLCTQWTEDPQKETNYSCTYGGVAVALSDCLVYKPTFNPQGPPYADPEGGVGSAPTPGPGGEPGAPPQDNGCPPPFSWTSLVNPWWYYKGVSCALQEVFVPSSSVVATEVNQTTGILNTKPPFSIATVVGPTVAGIGDGWTSACSAPVAAFDPWGKDRLTLGCKPPDSPSMRLLYSVATFAIVAATAFGAWHMVVNALGGRAGGED